MTVVPTRLLGLWSWGLFLGSWEHLSLSFHAGNQKSDLAQPSLPRKLLVRNSPFLSAPFHPHPESGSAWPACRLVTCEFGRVSFPTALHPTSPPGLHHPHRRSSQVTTPRSDSDSLGLRDCSFSPQHLYLPCPVPTPGGQFFEGGRCGQHPTWPVGLAQNSAG